MAASLTASEVATLLETSPPAQGAEAAPQSVDFPCSVAQERFWLLDRLEPGNPSYNVAVRWRLQGRVSTDLLQSAWLEIVTRHEVLRTRFLEVDGKPVQRVARDAAFRLVEVDLSTRPADERAPESDRIGLIEARAPFDLGSGPLLRVVLVRHSATDAVIFVTTHQIVSDGWSIGIMAREMGAIYEALARKSPSPLEPLPIQYGDYASWQLEWLKQRGTEAENRYWQRQLQGVRPFEVPADRPRPNVPTTNGAIASRVLPRELTNRMQALTAESGLTLFPGAVAVLCATLARYTGRTEVVIGTQVSDRDQVELEGMIGQFVNSLILRNELGGDPSFRELLARVGTTIAEALEHRHIPIERLLGMVKSGRGGSNAPPVSINFIFQRTFIENRHYGEFSLVDLPSLPAGAIYDLNFFMVERPDGWRLSCQFNTDQFEADTANRLLGYFQSALESALEDPARHVSQLRLDPAPAPLPSSAFVGEDFPLVEDDLDTLIARHAMSSPSSIAISDAERSLSFGALEAAANGLAARIAAHGRACVALALDDPRERAVSLLACLKAGAPVLLLDSRDPPAHLQRLIDAAAATLLIGRPELAGKLKTSAGAVTEVPLESSSRISTTLPRPGRADVAVLGYGVRDPRTLRIAPISRERLLGVLTGLQRRLSLSAGDVIVSTGPAEGEWLATEILLSMLSGARLVVGRDVSTGEQLVSLVRRSHASLVHAPAALLGAAAGSASQSPVLPKVLCDRGAIDAETAARLIEHSREVWAVHADAEASGSVSVRRLARAHDIRMLGRPLPGLTLQVLDARGQIPPIGASGQLHVGSAPTGEKARIRADGNIEMLDDEHDPQRLRGRRLGADDIARALEAEPGVREAAVLAGKAAGAVDRVTAFVALETPVSDATLQTYLSQEWPAALLPDRLVAVETLPRMPNGRVDLRRLQTEHPDEMPMATPEPATATDPEVERQLLEIWAELLGHRRIDPLGNFFELGGHSLLAARMLARVEAHFGRRITLSALFQAPTIRGLATLLRSEARDFDFRQMVKLQADGANLPLIAINNTGVYYLVAKRMGSQQPVTSLQLFDPAARHEQLPDTLESIAAEYVRLIQRVHPKGPYLLAGWCVAGALAFEIARQLVGAGEPVARLFLMDSWVPGYFARQSAPRRLIGQYTLRWQLMWADWRRVTSGTQTIRQFVAQRGMVRRLRRIFGAVAPIASSTPSPATPATRPEDYDRWLLEYLQDVTSRYEPKPLTAPVTLFRSTREPTGLWFDPLAGWGVFATGGADLEMIEGDHFTMFQDPGATRMAERMSKLIETERTP